MKQPWKSEIGSLNSLYWSRFTSLHFISLSNLSLCLFNSTHNFCLSSTLPYLRELTRSIPNVTTGLNVTIDVLKDKSSGPNLIRSSVVIDASPAAVASYYRPSQAEDLKIKTWSSYSALMNLARIESIEILFCKSSYVIFLQFRCHITSFPTCSHD